MAKPAYGLDDLDSEFLADASDDHFDGVRVAIEILVVEMLDQLGAGNHAAGVMHQIGKQPVFVAGEFDRIAVDRDAARTGVEPHRSAIELAFGVARRTTQKSAHAREHFFETEWLGDIDVGAGPKALPPGPPAGTPP